MGILGATVGGTNAIAKNAERLRLESVSEAGAAIDVGREALKNGVATALTFAVVGSIGGELIVSVGATLIIYWTLKYLWDRCAESVEASANTPQRRVAAPGRRAMPSRSASRQSIAAKPAPAEGATPPAGASVLGSMTMLLSAVISMPLNSPDEIYFVRSEASVEMLASAPLGLSVKPVARFWVLKLKPVPLPFEPPRP